MYILWLLTWGFYGTPECVNVCISASLSISYAFSLAPFPVLLFCHIPICLLFIYLILLLLFLGCPFGFLKNEERTLIQMEGEVGEELGGIGEENTIIGI